MRGVRTLSLVSSNTVRRLRYSGAYCTHRGFGPTSVGGPLLPPSSDHYASDVEAVTAEVLAWVPSGFASKKSSISILCTFTNVFQYRPVN